MNEHVYFKIISKLNEESLYNFSQVNKYFAKLCNFSLEKSNIGYTIYKKKLELFKRITNSEKFEKRLTDYLFEDSFNQTTPNYEKFFLCLFLTNLFLVYYWTGF